MELQETIEPEFEEKKDLEKEFKINEDNKSYQLKIILNNNQILFELNLISEISYYNYIRRYNYYDIMKDLNLSKDKYDNITKIFNHIDNENYKVLDDKNNKKLIINNKDTITLYENKNKYDDIIKILINEINILKEENKKQNNEINKLNTINKEKDDEIKKVVSKYNDLDKRLNITQDLLFKKEYEINIKYEDEGIQNIFGK